MKFFNEAILLFLFLFSKINCAGGTPDKKVLNTCGVIGYDQPDNADKCKESGKICCYVEISKTEGGTTTTTKFCVSSPSDIEKDDVEKEIKEYTGFTLEALKCNKGEFLYNSMVLALFFAFILF